MAMAEAFLRGHQIVIHATCATDGGGGACLPCFTLDALCSDKELGDVVTNVLSASLAAPIPEDFGNEWRKVLKAAGASSWSKLIKGAVYCSISAQDGNISITPSRREKSYFSHLPDSNLDVLSDGPAEALGAALRQGWQRSQ